MTPAGCQVRSGRERRQLLRSGTGLYPDPGRATQPSVSRVLKDLQAWDDARFPGKQRTSVPSVPHNRMDLAHKFPETIQSYRYFMNRAHVTIRWRANTSQASIYRGGIAWMRGLADSTTNRHFIVTPESSGVRCSLAHWGAKDTEKQGEACRDSHDALVLSKLNRQGRHRQSHDNLFREYRPIRVSVHLEKEALERLA